MIGENEYENKYYCKICRCDHRRTSKIGEKHYLLMNDDFEVLRFKRIAPD